MADQPQVTQITVNYNGSGKVAIMEYGKITSGYGASVSRTYTVPDDWDDTQVKDFELAKLEELRLEVEPILQAEFEDRYEQRNWK